MMRLNTFGGCTCVWGGLCLILATLIHICQVIKHARKGQASRHCSQEDNIFVFKGAANMSKKLYVYRYSSCGRGSSQTHLSILIN